MSAEAFFETPEQLKAFHFDVFSAFKSFYGEDLNEKSRVPKGFHDEILSKALAL